MSTQSSSVYEEIAEILGSYVYGVPMSCLFWLEESYEKKFKKPVEYESLGVKNIEELLLKMCDKRMALLSEDPESKRKYAMSARTVQLLQERVLKSNVESVLRRCNGEIPLNSFERIYKDRWLVTLRYDWFGLTGFDHLCKVLNLEVGPNNSGEMVVRERPHLLRFRKKKKRFAAGHR